MYVNERNICMHICGILTWGPTPNLLNLTTHHPGASPMSVNPRPGPKQALTGKRQVSLLKILPSERLAVPVEGDIELTDALAGDRKHRQEHHHDVNHACTCFWGVGVWVCGCVGWVGWGWGVCAFVWVPR